jgi:hypothetical protein
MRTGASMLARVVWLFGQSMKGRIAQDSGSVTAFST